MPRGTRPRTYCKVCGRSIAVTFNKRNGDAYVRTHKFGDAECPGSHRTIIPEMRNFHYEKPA